MEQTIVRLAAEGVKVDEELRAEIAALWHWGIEKISNPQLKASLVEYYRTAVPWQFFVSPSSASGKHHPPHHNRKGGIVRHLTECCILAPRLLRMYGFVNKTKDGEEIDANALDIVLAATLITDTCKNGSPWGEKTKPDHGDISAFEWTKIASRSQLDPSLINTIYLAVYWHYGRYTPNLNPKELLALQPLTQIVHLLDAISSSNEIKLLYTAVSKIEVPSQKFTTSRRPPLPSPWNRTGGAKQTH